MEEMEAVVFIFTLLFLVPPTFAFGPMLGRRRLFVHLSLLMTVAILHPTCRSHVVH